jgi:methyl-accepting chemotaxis protein
MKFLNDWRIGVRLGLAFAISIAFSVVLAGYARYALVEINEKLTLMVQDRLVKFERLEVVKHNLNAIAVAARNAVLRSDPAAKKQELAAVDKARASNAELIKLLDDSIKSERGHKLMAEVAEARAPYNASVQRVVDLSVLGDTDAARDLLLSDTQQLQLRYTTSLDALVTYQKDLMHGAADTTDELVHFAATAVLVAAGFAIAIGAALAWLITRSVVTPIQQAVQAAETVAGGDLRLHLDAARRDEAGQLLGALQRMNDSLVDIVGKVRGNADSVATASGQIAQGNADLSQRTEQQASSLQETAASMEELSATVNHNTDTARQAAQLADSAARVAVTGGQVMSQVVVTMEQITTSSTKIADIISTIDGIAFQTNILALNAAVEAARAGEQGRGFAVVAGEVRLLAQRSAEAAREIKTLIGASVERVTAGNTLVGEAGRTMDDVVSQVRRVADLISEISAASGEQSKGIGQVGEAVSQLDQVTQQNAALVEESAAAAEALRNQAAQLAETVSAFKLDANSAARSPAPAPAARNAAATKPKAAHRPAAASPRAPASKPAKPATAAPVPQAAKGGVARAAVPLAAATAGATAAASDDDWTSF